MVTPQTIWVYSKERFITGSSPYLDKSHVTIATMSGELVKENAFDMYDSFIVYFPDSPEYPEYNFSSQEICNKLMLITIDKNEERPVFPHIGTSGGEIFWYDNTTGSYINKTPLNRWNQDKDEYINFVDEEGSLIFSRLTFLSFWCQGGKIYALTGTGASNLRLWEYTTIEVSERGSCYCGPITTTSYKTRNKY